MLEHIAIAFTLVCIVLGLLLIGTVKGPVFALAALVIIVVLAFTAWSSNIPSDEDEA